ncbi:TSUP family transporter [Dinoroseobacter sp. S375]|uniref:TSUP family transporter n=1 Tax=Dinoroseobacter sp. S375 TaxID=3415136 RepID=UPI003C7AB878
MPEMLEAGLATPGLFWLCGISALAGLIYGFAGFGAALIFMPLATIFIAPSLAVGAFSLSALSSVFTVVPGALRAADLKAAGTMLAAAVLATFPGVWVLNHSSGAVLQWAVSGVVIATLIALIAGLRYTRAPGPRTWLSVGTGVGFLGGATGLNGPVMVLFQLGGQDEAARSRANTIIVLTFSSLAFLPVMALQGAVPPSAVSLGLFLLIPYAIGTTVGRMLFTPARAGLYRVTAYVIIAAAAILGLPIEF